MLSLDRQLTSLVRINGHLTDILTTIIQVDQDSLVSPRFSISTDPSPEHPHGTRQNSLYPLWYNPTKSSCLSSCPSLHRYTSLHPVWIIFTCPSHCNLLLLIDELTGLGLNNFITAVFLRHTLRLCRIKAGLNNSLVVA